MEKISSRKNRIICHMRSVASDNGYRAECRQFICDGEKTLREALSFGADVKQVLWTEGEQLPTQERLDLYDKYAKDNPDYIQDILSTREIIQDYQSTYNIVNVLKDIIDDTVNDYNDFEEVCCNID